MPSYNHENTTESSICSIQNHKFSKIEIILINDFSNDNTFLIIRNIQKR